MLIDVIDKGQLPPSLTSVIEYPKVFRNCGSQTKNQRGRLIDFFSMLIGHVRWIGLLANVWCSNHSEFSEKMYATRSLTLKKNTFTAGMIAL